MKNLIIIVSVLILGQLICHCSDSGTNPGAQPADNRILYYDLLSNFYISDENFFRTDTIVAGSYPIWLDSKSKIGFHSPANWHYYVIDSNKMDTLNIYDLMVGGSFIAGRYSEFLRKFLFALNNNGMSSIALMDENGSIDIITGQTTVSNPVCSAVDDWIYFLKNFDGTADVYRIKADGSSEESLTNSPDFIYSNFSVSYNGNYIVVPKFNDLAHYIAIIDTRDHDEQLIDLTFLNLVGYTSFSRDNRYIYFTGGENRDLYRINFDGSGLKRLTTSGFLYRPLSW